MPSTGVFVRARWAAFVATLLAIVAAFQYPGGTFNDHSTRGYSFTRNFLSDLGATVAHNGAPNRLGAVLFVVALLLLVIGVGGSLVGFVRLHSATPESRTFARLAGAIGLLVCLCFAGVAVTPENRLLGPHIFLTKAAFRLFPLVPLFLFIASLRVRDIPRGARAAWFFLTVMLAGYVAVLDFGPRASTPVGLLTQVTAQKIITITVVATFVYLSVTAERRMVAAASAAHTLEPT
jgi:hypothetical membrane protein